MKKGTLLQVAQLGHKVIKQKAKEVKNVKDAEIQKLIDDMEATCLDVDGVGIAAPQVYQSLNIFIVASQSLAKTKDWEGCLSIPGIRAIVPRHTSISVEYTDRNGKQTKEKLTGFVARVFQHEYDHLQGNVIVDRVDSKDLITEKEYQKIVNA